MSRNTLPHDRASTEFLLCREEVHTAVTSLHASAPSNSEYSKLILPVLESPWNVWRQLARSALKLSQFPFSEEEHDAENEFREVIIVGA